jgi:molecular chaperone DnaK
MPQIEVTFDIDVDGILNVSAKDRATNKEQKVRIEQSIGISSEEIRRMRKEADSHADEDKKKRELAEARNHAERLVYECEKLLKEFAHKLDTGSKAVVESAIARAKEAGKGNNVAVIKSAIEGLEQATHVLSKHIYESGDGQ